MNERRRLDEKDIALLVRLQEEGRVSLSALGREIGLSQPAVSERVARLEQEGVITGFGARVDGRKLALPASAIVRLSTTHDRIAACLEWFERAPNVLDVARVTGEDCFVLRVVFARPEELEVIVDDIGWFGAVTTSLVLRAEAPKIIGRELLRQG